MAVLKKEDLIKKLTEFLGESPSDEGVTLLEDVTDTVTNLEGDGTDWKAKYEENDKNWKAKYIARFSGKGEGDDDHKDDEPEDKKPPSFESLFKGDKDNG